MSLFTQARAAHGIKIVRDVTATPLVDHVERCVYVSEQVVTKVDTDARRLTREARVTAELGAQGFPVPRVLAVGEAPPAVMALSFVAGEPLGSDSPDADWAAVGAALRRLHETPYVGLDVPVFGERGTWWRNFRRWPDHECAAAALRADVAPGPLEALRELMNDAFADRPEPESRLLHGDCGPYHWLLDEGRVTAAVDFGDTATGDVVWDLAVLTLWDTERIGVVLDGYDADAALRTRVAELLLPYQVIRHMSAHSWLVEHEVDPAPTADELNRIAATL